MMTRTLCIEKIVHGGLGLARTSEGVVFAEGVLPGETIEAVIDPSKRVGGVLLATQIRIVKESLLRRPPVCPLFGICGGCDWLHIGYETQLSLKQEIFRETMTRTGHVGDIGPLTVLASPEFGYRRRVQFKIDPVKNEAGFFRRKSNSVVPVPRCPLLCDSLNELLNKLALYAPELGPGVSELKVIAGDALGREEDKAQSLLLSSSPVLRGITSERAVIRCGPYEFPVTGNGFFQANRHLCFDLGTLVADWSSGETFLDLYGGSGFFSVFAAAGSKFKSGISVDIAEDHGSVFRETMSRNGLSSVVAVKSTVLDFLKKCIVNSAKADCCIIDPPRTGLERGVVQCLAALGPDTIVYVSCNPATQARDAGFLINQCGYCCEKAALVDCYPQTHHLETVLLLSKKK
jgi:23S rRNA (uracil1939-C5)-methyltransferase